MNITEELIDCKLQTPIDSQGNLMSSSWIIKVDPLNSTIEWRDHPDVRKMDYKLKQKIEKEYSYKYKDMKWVKEFKACTKITGKNTPKRHYNAVTVWATGKNAAAEIFKLMNINYITINYV